MRAGRVLVVMVVLAGVLAVAPAGGAVTVEYEEFVPVQVALGDSSVCAVSASGDVKCWGWNRDGELGLGDTGNRGGGPGQMGEYLPTVDLGGDATAVTVGLIHSCALLASGGVKCWGANNVGQLGLGDTARRGDGPGEMGSSLPVVDLGGVATAVSAGGQHTCALLESGAVKCWGWNEFGQLGLGDTEDRGDGSGEMGAALPAVDLDEPAVAVSSGWGFTCALLESGAAKCWGQNEDGQLGQGDMFNRGDGQGEMGASLPPLNLGGTVTMVGAGGKFACALLSTSEVKCWGGNGAAQLGSGDSESRGDEPGEMGLSLPALSLGGAASGLVVGGGHSCASLASGGFKCWGYNDEGALGLCDTNSRGDAPGEMGAALPLVDCGLAAAQVFVGLRNTCALSSFSELKCWGPNSQGQLGLGDTETRGWAEGDQCLEFAPVDLGWVWDGVRVPVGGVTLTVRTRSGVPLVGASVTWQATDGSVGSAGPKVTDAAGQVRFGMVSGPTVIVAGGATLSESVELVGGSATVFADGRPLAVVFPDPPPFVTREVSVSLPSGDPVAEATVTLRHYSETAEYQTIAAMWQGAGTRVNVVYETSLLQPQNGPRAVTDGYGSARFVGFPSHEYSEGKPDVDVEFSDGVLRQTKTAKFDGSGVARVTLPFMPWVDLETPGDVTVAVGAGVDVVVSAVDDAGDPLAGRSVVLEATSGRSSMLSGARGSCTPKLSGITDADGRVTLRLCAAGSGIWHVDGTSLVPSAPVRVTVPSCGGKLATKVGSAGAESLSGTTGADVIVGLGGDDTIDGKGGDDRICGGLGNDFIYGGLGNDRLWGDGGRDRLFGEGGDDILLGGAGSDRAVGGLGSDRCVAEHWATCEL